MDSLSHVGIKITYVLALPTVYGLTGLVFRCLFPSLLRNKHQNNPSCTHRQFTIQVHTLVYIYAVLCGNLMTYIYIYIYIYTYIWVPELGHHWFRKWFVTFSTPSHYMNHCWLPFFLLPKTSIYQFEWRPNCNIARISGLIFVLTAFDVRRHINISNIHCFAHVPREWWDINRS